MAERRILVVAAHPDDEVLGAGGTIAGHSRRGDRVGILLLGGGEGARASGPELTVRAEQELQGAARHAARIVGADVLDILDFPDNAFDSVPLLELVRAVETIAGQFEPNVIYTHHGGDLNIDHERTCRAVLTATRPVSLGSPDVYAFEVRSATDWSDGLSTEAVFRPNAWCSLSDDDVAAKREALHAYGREMRPFPHSRSHEAVDALMLHRGAQAGVSAAEAFMLLRSVRTLGSV